MIRKLFHLTSQQQLQKDTTMLGRTTNPNEQIPDFIDYSEYVPRRDRTNPEDVRWADNAVNRKASAAVAWSIFVGVFLGVLAIWAVTEAGRGLYWNAAGIGLAVWLMFGPHSFAPIRNGNTDDV